jgi:hypothetical protein
MGGRKFSDGKVKLQTLLNKFEEEKWNRGPGGGATAGPPPPAAPLARRRSTTGSCDTRYECKKNK